MIKARIIFGFPLPEKPPGDLTLEEMNQLSTTFSGPEIFMHEGKYVIGVVLEKVTTPSMIYMDTHDLEDDGGYYNDLDAFCEELDIPMQAPSLFLVVD